jgi:hypothetical protein
VKGLLSKGRWVSIMNPGRVGNGAGTGEEFLFGVEDGVRVGGVIGWRVQGGSVMVRIVRGIGDEETLVFAPAVANNSQMEPKRIGLDSVMSLGCDPFVVCAGVAHVCVVLSLRTMVVTRVRWFSASVLVGVFAVRSPSSSVRTIFSIWWNGSRVRGDGGETSKRVSGMRGGVFKGWWGKVVFSRVNVVVVVGDVSKAVAALVPVIHGRPGVIPLLFVVSKNVVVKAVLVGGSGMASKKGSVMAIIK